MYFAKGSIRNPDPELPPSRNPQNAIKLAMLSAILKTKSNLDAVLTKSNRLSVLLQSSLLLCFQCL